MYPQLILHLIQSCEEAATAGVCQPEIRNRLLPDKVQHALKTIVARDFVEWVSQDPDYRYYYRELQQSGISANPREAAAMILEAIVLDAIE
ncbi:MAG TPA: hypothetical protein VGQ81_15175 [Acidobacteriota bacterium]|jgi:hypothetical protein|nr:hypothetical protein [Acidobacteriota bacterium]